MVRALAPDQPPRRRPRPLLVQRPGLPTPTPPARRARSVASSERHELAAQGDKKLRGTVKLVPGSFNIQCTEAPAAKKKKKGDRDFPLTVLIEVPNRDPVRLATDNDREMRGWVEVTKALLLNISPSSCSALI